MTSSSHGPVAAAQHALDATKEAIRTGITEVAAAVSGKQVPGVPGVEPPSYEKPATPREPLPPKADQQAPASVTPTGAATNVPVTANAQNGEYLTTAQGVRRSDTDHSLKVGPRGPVILQDHLLREKIMHFDHERIPERVVHARGAAAHGTFRSNGAASNVTCAAVFAEGAETPVFVRFSTVLGSRGSADSVRDTRGFATKFYTEEGNWDLVGNNMPVFFIQDGIKFPDIVHAAKPHPDREIPQAQSAHDTFWDFVSLNTEAQHHTMWNMSDRGIPRSYRTMEGFGVHTFRLVDASGATTLVKFHWKPAAGVHSLTWEEAQLAAGADPDFHRRDLADAIEAGAHPSWELGIQTFPDTPDQTFRGIDLLDPTKLVPEELAPVQVIGTMTLNGNPSNYFAETEQVAFCTSHMVRGIDATDDPLLAARNFSYLDTQLTRLGGPNFAQIPINRPHVPVNDNYRDGWHQDAVHSGVAPYHPNTLDAGNPLPAGPGARPFIDVPSPVEAATKVREAPASYDDHFSQTRMFWLSMTPVEQDHIIQAYTFELGKLYEQTIKERQLQALANIDARLCAEVAGGLGLPAPIPTVPLVESEPSPSLSQIGETWPVDGRLVGILVDADADADGVAAVVENVFSAGMVPLIIAPRGGKVFVDSASGPLDVSRTLLTARSIEFDTVLVAGALTPGEDAAPSRDAKAGAPTPAPSVDPRVSLLLNEMFRHCKAFGAWGTGTTVLESLGYADQPGVVTGESGEQVLEQLQTLLGEHRVWHRFPASVS